MVRARYFRSELEGPHLLDIVLPIYARFTRPPRRKAGFLQKRSRGAGHVLDVEGRQFLIDWSILMETDEPARFLDIFGTGIQREQNAVVDIRRIVDWAEQRPEIDGSRVARIGCSRGAIVAGIAPLGGHRLCHRTRDFMRDRLGL